MNVNKPYKESLQHKPEQCLRDVSAPDFIPFWGKPSPSGLQRYFKLLDEEARLRELGRQEMIKGTYWMRQIIWLLEDVGGALRPVEIVNRVTRRFQFECWKDKFDKRIELLKLVGLMVRQGRLERYQRVRVRIPAPGQDHKFQAWVKAMSQPLIFPKPRLS